MNVRGKLGRRTASIVLLGLVAGLPVRFAPAVQAPVAGPINQHPAGLFNGPLEMDPIQAQRQLKALNEARQKLLVRDADRLLRLALELRDEVAASGADHLTPVQLRKLGDMEKLARSVREKMSYSATGGPEVNEPRMPGLP